MASTWRLGLGTAVRVGATGRHVGKQGRRGCMAAPLTTTCASEPSAIPKSLVSRMPHKPSHVMGDRVLSQRGLGTFSRSIPRHEVNVMNLPGLGDSISEGVVVQWTKQVGDVVAEEEVVAVIETDKISVDIRATQAGVLVKQFVAVDDTVEVGSPLCSIDGDQLATAKVEEEAVEEASKTPPPKPKEPNLEDAMAGAFMAGADFVAPKKKFHQPLIKFLGKRSLLREEEALVSQEPTPHRHTLGALDVGQIVGGAMFGRPAMTEEEMAAVDSGGAEGAPNVRFVDRSQWLVSS